MYKYIEVIEFKTNKVTHRIDVTGKPERQIERVEDGLNINLNHELYYTQVNEYTTKQL